MATGNFCTLNPLAKSPNATVNYGNLYLPSVSYPSNVLGTMGVSSGKWYFEARCENNYGAYDSFGVITSDEFTYKDQVGNSIANSISWHQLDTVRLNGSDQGTTSPSLYNSNTKIVGCALDLDNNKIYFHGNNTYVNSHNPSTGTGGYSIPTSMQGKHFLPLMGTNAVGAPAIRRANFGQDSSFGGDETAQNNSDDNGHGDFYYAPPTGFLAICSANLPVNTNQDPAQGTPPDFSFEAVKYTGNGSSQNITSLNFSPNFIWIKNLDQSDSWAVQDTINGVGKTKAMDTASAYASETNCITAFNSNGFSLGSNHKVNASSENYIAYCFKESQEAGLDMFSYTGVGDGTTVVSHNLGETPKMVWIFLVSGSATDTMVYIDTPDMGHSYGIFPSLSNARQNTSYVPATSSTNITVGSSANATGRGYFACLFAEREGFSKFGQFTATGTEDNAFCYLGFKPRLLIIKSINASGQWMVFDTARETANPIDQNIHLDLSDAELTEDYRDIDILSTGFKVRSDNGNLGHPSNNKYIFMAWAEQPARFSNAF